MRTILLVAASLMLTSTAHASCWAWVMKGNDLICELRGPPPAGVSYPAPQINNSPGPGTFVPTRTITTESHMTIRSYRGR